jgi:hypothetical protein
MTTDEAVSIIYRVCPDDEAGEVARRICSEGVINEEDPTEWAKRDLNEILHPLFESAVNHSQGYIDRLVDSKKYGSSQSELESELTQAVNKTLVFAQVIVHVTHCREKIRESM